MKIEIELTAEQELYLRENSLERIANHSINCLDRKYTTLEDIDIHYNNIEELKRYFLPVYLQMQNAIFIENSKKEGKKDGS